MNYEGGICGFLNKSNAKNNYNIGTLDGNGTIGGISGYKNWNSNVKNSYYCTSTIQNTTYEHMKSLEFYNTLNIDGVWAYQESDYPILNNQRMSDITSSTEITIANTIKKFKITTYVQENNGVKGGTITGEGEEPYETVVINNSNTKEIIMTPDSNYGISNIIINGETIDYKVNEDGTYTIPAGYFEKMQEDKFVVVTYARLDQILTIKKVDENDNTKLLEGAIFKVEQQNQEGDYFTGEFETNAYGEIRITVPTGITYVITELEAPEGYVLNNEQITYEVKSGEDNIVTIANKQQRQLIVHHYLKENDGTYTTKKVAEDEIQKGNVGETYTTSPKVDLEGLELQKTTEGVYVIPENATGVFTEEAIEVIYYYEALPIELKINHYLAGTNITLAEEKTEQYDPEITFEDEGIYNVTTEGSYEINKNEDYNTLIESYNLRKIESTVKEELNAEEILTFSENAELVYDYDLKEYKITTTVKEHTELRTNKITNNKEEIIVKGGTITGEDVSPFEVVSHSANSTKTIKTTPDEGYIVSKITLISTKEDGTTTTTEIYGENEDSNSEITYTKNDDGSVTLSTFSSVTEYKHIIVEFAPILGKVIVHHYIEGTGEEFGNEPQRPLLEDGITEVQDETKKDYIDEQYATKQIENISSLYKFVSTSGQTSGKYIDGEIHVYYYYNLKDYKYTIHYFYDGIEDATKAELDILPVKYGTVITDYPDKPEGYIFKQVTPANTEDQTKTNLTVTENESENVINVYYGTLYKITTDVVEHIETFKDRTTQNVKGGTISGEDLELYENVFKGENTTIEKAIKIIPEVQKDGNGNIIAEYEIVKITLKNGKDATEEVVIDFTDYLNEDGSVTLSSENGFFTDVQSDKHIEVEFRRKTSVKVKYLEEGTRKILTEENIIAGYEGKEFEISRKPITYYEASDLGVTYEDAEKAEDMTKFDEENENRMYADSYTIIYWYKPMESGIIVRHIEIDEQEIKDGLTLDFGKELDVNTLTKEQGYTQTTNRNTYENYVAIDGPVSDNEDIIIVSKNSNTQEVTFEDKEIIEVRYYYIKQYNISTEVKLHTETIDGVEVQVSGGKISGEGQDLYEKVNNRGSNKNKIEITPDAGYRVKELTINGKTVDISGLQDESHNVILGKGYLTDVQEDKHIVVEFEKIPAKVIVEYRDAGTDEKLLADKVIEGLVNDEYTEERVEIDNYIKAEPEPTNSKGKMTEDTIIVVYYYQKQFKITTDVVEHLEDAEKGFVDVTVNEKDEDTQDNQENNENSNQGNNQEIDSDKKEQILVKGGSITAEDKIPYEIVLRGNNNTKEIEIKPDEGYRVKSIIIQGEKSISIESVLTEDNKIIIPAGYFENMQSDKHIIVEFERIPAKVIVNYLDRDTKEKIAKTETGEGFVSYAYKTYEKLIQYYELVKEEYPENADGILAAEETRVNYWYRKLLFNMKITKEFSSILVNGEEYLKEDRKFAKVDISNEEISNTNIIVKYIISVTNTEEIEGTATLVEQIPVGFTLSEKSKQIWKDVDGKLQLVTRSLKPGETAEYEIELVWNKDLNCFGTLENVAKIIETENGADFSETTLEDNLDSCTLILAIRTRENRDLKTIISMSCFILAGICTVVYVGTEVYARRKED